MKFEVLTFKMEYRSYEYEFIQEHLFNHVLEVYLNVYNTRSLSQFIPPRRVGAGLKFSFFSRGAKATDYVPLSFLRSLAKGIVLNQSLFFIFKK